MELEEAKLINYFNYLPDETVLNIALDLNLSSILNLCRTDKRFSNIICDDKYFWKQKYIKDYGGVDFETNDWKLLYINGRNVIKFRGMKNIATLGGIDALEVGTTGELSYSIIIDTNNNTWVWTRDKEPFNLNIRAKKVSCSEIGAMFIDIEDRVWVTRNWNTLTFSGSTKLDRLLYPLVGFDNIKAKEISLGTKHLGIIDLNNNIWMSGQGTSGQLGLGNTENKDNIIMLPGFKAKKIECGRECTSFIDLEDNLWTFGNNQYGQLGLGDNDSRSIPSKVQGIKVKEVTMDTHTMVIDLEGKMWGFGLNSRGQLSMGSNIDMINVPTQVVVDNKWKKVSAYRMVTTAIDINNNVWMCGLLHDPGSSQTFLLGSVEIQEVIHRRFKKIDGYKIFNLDTSIQTSIFIGTKLE